MGLTCINTLKTNNISRTSSTTNGHYHPREVVKLTEECSATVLNCLSEKKKDPGCLTIMCSIGTWQFDHALCNLGASVNVMPKVMFDKLNFTHLAPMLMMLQLADPTSHLP